MFSISTYHLDFGTSAAMEHNVFGLGDVQPCSKFQFSTNVIGCILPNRCYVLGGLSALNLI
jgi:hypothetical protein